VKSLTRLEDSDEPTVDLTLSFVLQYSIKKTKTWNLKIKKYYKENAFHVGGVLAQINTWFNDQKPSGM